MRRLVPIAALGLLSALPCAAQNMKPGLWEIQQRPELSAEQQAKMAEARKAMDGMPAEQKAMMERMMAQRGVSMNIGGDGAITAKVCLSKEQAERNAPPMADANKQCTQDTKRSGNVIRTHFSCADSGTEGDSEVTLTANGYTSKTRVTHNRKGKPETVTMTGEARWLGADCGGLKPAGTP